MDIKELKDVVRFGISLGERIASALEDGELTWADAFKFVGVLGEASDALKGAQSIPGEMMDLSVDEKAELDAMVVTEFNIPNDKVEAYIEQGFKVATAIAQIVTEWRTK